MNFPDSALHSRVLFNVGAQRSGTFWLQRVITTHPAISAVPSETALFSDGIKPLFERFQHAAKDSPQVGAIYIERDRLVIAARQFCDMVLAPYAEAGTRYVAERTAVHVRHLALIAEIYPDARFVHIIRDGRDVARSVVAQPWGHESVGEAAAEWRSSVEDAREAGLSARQYREVRYERLLDNPESEIAELYEWLGLPATDRELDEALTEARRRKNVDRHGQAGVSKSKWESTFDREDLLAFEAAAGDLLRELGYSDAASAADAPLNRPVLERIRGAGHGIGKIVRKRGSRTGPETVPLGRRLAAADRVIGYLRPGYAAQLLELTAPDFLFRLVTPDGEELLRADDARERLARTIHEDGALAGRQTLGHVHAGGSTIGYVLRFDAGGREEHRVVFITVQSDRATELTLYLI